MCGDGKKKCRKQREVGVGSLALRIGRCESREAGGRACGLSVYTQHQQEKPKPISCALDGHGHLKKKKKRGVSVLLLRIE